MFVTTAGNAQVFRLGGTPGKDAGVHGEVGILDANVQVLHGDNESVIGAGASIADYAVTAGSKDNNVRLGASMGVGAAGRLHYSLDPETHKRSYGFGVDAGPVSFDARTDVFSDEELAPTPDAPMVNPEDDDGGATFRQPITAYAEPATGG